MRLGLKSAASTVNNPKETANTERGRRREEKAGGEKRRGEERRGEEGRGDAGPGQDENNEDRLQQRQRKTEALLVLYGSVGYKEKGRR